MACFLGTWKCPQTSSVIACTGEDGRKRVDRYWQLYQGYVLRNLPKAVHYVLNILLQRRPEVFQVSFRRSSHVFYDATVYLRGERKQQRCLEYFFVTSFWIPIWMVHCLIKNPFIPAYNFESGCPTVAEYWPQVGLTTRTVVNSVIVYIRTTWRPFRQGVYFEHRCARLHFITVVYLACTIDTVFELFS